MSIASISFHRMLFGEGKNALKCPQMLFDLQLSEILASTASGEGSLEF